MRQGDLLRIVIQHTEGCPHVALAESRARQALDRLGIDATLETMLVRTIADAEAVQFTGSPTILVEGEDRFPRDCGAALACRIYHTESGLEGAPSVEQIVSTLSING